MATVPLPLDSIRLREFLGLRAVQSAATVAALLVFAVTLALSTWRLLPPPERPLAERTGASGGVDLSMLATTNPFGQGGGDASPAPVTSGLARTSLNLVLTGVMLGNKGGCALLSVDGAPEAAYCMGESILPGVSLDALYRDRVVISRNGARELVMLKETDSVSLLGGAGASQALAPQSIVQTISPRRHIVQRREFQQQLNRPEFLSQALIVPNPDGGFLVREVQSGSLYEQLGLRPGDVIRAVNGQALQSVDQVMQMYQQFSTMGRVVVEVQRQGRTESLYYDMR